MSARTTGSIAPPGGTPSRPARRPSPSCGTPRRPSAGSGHQGGHRGRADLPGTGHLDRARCLAV